jgi:hydroxyacylglutathione hydrolase
MKIICVQGNTYCIDTGMTYIPFYKINDTKIIMLDTGWMNEREEIEKLLTENDYSVVGIISTHSHIDHIGNNQYFKDKYGAIIAMSKDEAHICSSIVSLKLYYSRYTYTDIEKRYGSMVCETDIEIQDNQEILLIFGTKFKIIHTPGHSPGHICIITPDKVAYLGDALISEIVMQSAKLPYAHILSRDLESKKKLAELDCDRYILAHKKILCNIDTIIEENIKFYKYRASKVLDEITKCMTLEDILRKIVSQWNIVVNSVNKYIVIERMLRYYIEYLCETKAIYMTIDDGFLKYARVNSQSLC